MRISILELAFELSGKLLTDTFTNSLTIEAGDKSYYMENKNATP